jgi:nucleotide-binding universal stress UspA family protein
MAHKILIGLDGSLYSETAVELGIRWALRNEAELTGLAVVDEPTIRRADPAADGVGFQWILRDEARLRDARHRVDRLLEKFVERCKQAGVGFRARREVGLPSAEILAEEEKFDLTLLGKRTYFHFETQADEDETLDVVLRHSHRPVVAVPMKLPAPAPAVVAYDASPAAGRALAAFRGSGLYEGQAIHVVSVARVAAVASRHAEEGACLLQSHGIPAEPRPLTAAGPVEECLLGEIQTLGAGLVVMGAHGGSSFWEFLFASTTQTILERSETLLFLHH